MFGLVIWQCGFDLPMAFVTGTGSDSKWKAVSRPGLVRYWYHYVILNGWIASNLYHPDFNGHVETGRPLDDDPVVSGKEIGAHVKGFNRHSIGICLIGKSGQFTHEQLNASLRLVHKLESQYQEIEIFQHSDLDKRKLFCAGLNMSRWGENYRYYKSVLRSW